MSETHEINECPIKGHEQCVRALVRDELDRLKAARDAQALATLRNIALFAALMAAAVAAERALR